MMRFLVSLCICISAWSTCQAKDLYMKIDFAKGDSSSYEYVGSTAACNLRPGGSCNGIFWISDNQSGVVSGGLKADINEPAAEFLYQLGVLRLGQDTYMLSCSISNLFVEADGTIEGGRQSYSVELIYLEKQKLISVGSDRNGAPYMFVITLYDDLSAISSSELWTGPRIVLLSRQMIDGVSWSVAKNSKAAVEKETEFTTTFSTRPDDPEQRSLKYQFLTTLADLPDKIEGPFRTTLNIERRYTINSHQPDSGQREFHSSHSKQIELRPGKLTVLVIPPDTPSVGGFNILDTLRIFPGSNSD